MEVASQPEKAADVLHQQALRNFSAVLAFLGFPKVLQGIHTKTWPAGLAPSVRSSLAACAAPLLYHSITGAFEECPGAQAREGATISSGVPPAVVLQVGRSLAAAATVLPLKALLEEEYYGILACNLVADWLYQRVLRPMLPFASTAVMALSAAQLLSSFALSPAALPPSYHRFL
eukprot:RCo016859